MNKDPMNTGTVHDERFPRLTRQWAQAQLNLYNAGQQPGENNVCRNLKMGGRYALVNTDVMRVSLVSWDRSEVSNALWKLTAYGRAKYIGYDLKAWVEGKPLYTFAPGVAEMVQPGTGMVLLQQRTFQGAVEWTGKMDEWLESNANDTELCERVRGLELGGSMLVDMGAGGRFTLTKVEV